MPRSVNSHWYFILNLQNWGQQGGSAVKNTMHCSCKFGSQHPCRTLVSLNTCTLMHISKQRYIAKNNKAFMMFWIIIVGIYGVCMFGRGHLPLRGVELRGQLCGLHSLCPPLLGSEIWTQVVRLACQTPVAFTHWTFLLTLLIFPVHKRQHSLQIETCSRFFCTWLV